MPKRLAVVDPDKCVGCLSCMFACSRKMGESGLHKSAIHVRSVGGFERGFTVIVCRACRDPPCASVCPVGALTPREGGGVVVRPEKCIGCRNCATACPIGAIFWDEEEDKPLICVHCGYCVEYCPYGVIKLEEVR